ITARKADMTILPAATITVQAAWTAAAGLTARPPMSMDRKKVMTTQGTKKTAAAKMTVHRAPMEVMYIKL
ncbi:MAG: hypothetical protein J6S47_07020, partial [Eubacteriaceae bacterium]|nr:hypothetical protein [Eubacteriaceae bacterium]